MALTNKLCAGLDRASKNKNDESFWMTLIFLILRASPYASLSPSFVTRFNEVISGTS